MACAGCAIEDGRGVATPDAGPIQLVPSAALLASLSTMRTGTEFVDNAHWDPAAWLNMTLKILYGLNKDGSPTTWQQRLCTWHKVKLVPHLHLVVDAYYAAFFGAPKVADLPPGDAHEAAPCTFHARRF